MPGIVQGTLLLYMHLKKIMGKKQNSHPFEIGKVIHTFLVEKFT